MKLPAELVAEIQRLYAVESWKVGTIARLKHVHHRRVSRIVGRTPPPPPRRKWDLLLTPYHAFIVETLRQYPTLCATRLYDMLRERGYGGSANTVRRYVKPLRPRKIPEAFLLIETLPGEQAQVDWAHVGQFCVEGGTRALWMFVMVLAHSRALYAELVLDLTVHSLVRSLVRACRHFGGCTRQWLFDNPKTVVLARAGEDIRFHPALLDAAVAMRVQPRLCVVRKPTDKGKVERAIRYLRDRFLAGRTIHNLETSNALLLTFLHDVADQRPHPRLQPRTVGDVFAQERTALLTLPGSVPDGARTQLVRVDAYASVRFETNRYSVPPEHVQKTVLLRADDLEIRVFDGTTCIASHPRCFGKHKVVENPAHRKQLLLKRRRAKPTKGRDRLLAAAPDVEKLLATMFTNGQNIGLCTVRLLKLLDLYGEESFRRGVADLNANNTCELSALAVRCDAHRRSLNAPTQLPVTLPKGVVDRDVIPHNLEDYDE